MSKNAKRNDMKKNPRAKAERPAVPMSVLDSVVEIACEARRLSEAVECAHTAMQTEFNDPMDYLEGTVAVLVLASDSLAEKSSALRDELYDMLDQ